MSATSKCLQNSHHDFKKKVFCVPQPVIMHYFSIKKNEFMILKHSSCYRWQHKIWTTDRM